MQNLHQRAPWLAASLAIGLWAGMVITLLSLAGGIALPLALAAGLVTSGGMTMGVLKIYRFLYPKR